MNSDRDDAPYSRRMRGSRTGGAGAVILILVGLVALALTQGLIQFDLRSILPNVDVERIWPGFNWGLAWPMFLLIPGLLFLVGAAMSSDPRQRVEKLGSGVVLVVLSAFFFASMWGVVAVDLWPVLLLVAGGLLLLRSKVAGTSL